MRCEKTKLLSLLAIMIMGILCLKVSPTSTVEAAGKTKAMVSTQKDLNKALKNKSLKTLVIKTTQDDPYGQSFSVGKSAKKLNIIVKPMYGTKMGIILKKGAKVASVDVNGGNGSSIYVNSNVKTKIKTNTAKSREVRVYLNSGATGTSITNVGDNCFVQNHTNKTISVKNTSGEIMTFPIADDDEEITSLTGQFDPTMRFVILKPESGSLPKTAFCRVDGKDYSAALEMLGENYRIVFPKALSDGEHEIEVETLGHGSIKINVSGTKTVTGIETNEPAFYNVDGQKLYCICLLPELEKASIVYKIDGTETKPHSSFISDGGARFTVRFSTSTLSSGKHTLTVEAPGYDTYTTEFTL